jgi:UDP-N-acetylglucosamine diphosphorylase/glucosamine-1-phosphate N-acetyltransferase
MSAMNIVLFDDQHRANLLPLAYTRPVADIRVGIITIREKWETFLGKSTSSSTESYLSAKFPLEVASENLFINGSVFPTTTLVQSIQKLEPGKALVQGDVLVAVVLDADSANSFDPAKNDWSDTETYSGNLSRLSALWDVFSMNGEQIQADFDMITAGKTSQKASSTNNIIGNNLFIENGAIVEYATINTEQGAVYIAKDAEIMEGSLIRGPFALCEGAQVKMGTKVYGATTVGPGSRIGGEVTNCVIQAYSNKGHDGFLGNSVIGEWCNLGADTNNSNLKNNYGEVKMWNYAQRDYQPTGLQFCGLVMGDHSKTGINTMFNTGTVVGVNANVFGSGFPDKFIPSFSWGGAEGFSTFDVEKAKEVAVKMYERRGLEFDKIDQDILNKIFEMTKEFRT